jgi:hypothetical protein
MAKHPFLLLESMLATADEQLAQALIEKGKDLLKQHPKFKDYAVRQCKRADAALQGKNTVDEILLIDNSGISSLKQLWGYRQRMALICELPVHEAALPSPSTSPIELLCAIHFGYTPQETPAPEVIAFCKKQLNAHTNEGVNCIKDVLLHAQLKHDHDYSRFIQTNYPEYLS